MKRQRKWFWCLLPKQKARPRQGRGSKNVLHDLYANRLCRTSEVSKVQIGSISSFLCSFCSPKRNQNATQKRKTRNCQWMQGKLAVKFSLVAFIGVASFVRTAQRKTIDFPLPRRRVIRTHMRAQSTLKTGNGQGTVITLFLRRGSHLNTIPFFPLCVGIAPIEQFHALSSVPHNLSAHQERERIILHFGVCAVVLTT